MLTLELTPSEARLLLGMSAVGHAVVFDHKEEMQQAVTQAHADALLETGSEETLLEKMAALEDSAFPD